ncbi:hypothetical protein [Actinomadura rubrisoli]|uniref:Uncharacterized protein n=1 Tax=Actinomadura rubrisoli TaxID=2530368 RepID=A0A4R5B849_9ACTN|nr:hypothetical protein [Actinomadura rubrisoli]TDD79854.1 hypothetical protein E1298_26910 [Actinomadura rubrisoli]
MRDSEEQRQQKLYRHGHFPLLLVIVGGSGGPRPVHEADRMENGQIHTGRAHDEVEQSPDLRQRSGIADRGDVRGVAEEREAVVQGAEQMITEQMITLRMIKHRPSSRLDRHPDDRHRPFGRARPKAGSTTVRGRRERCAVPLAAPAASSVTTVQDGVKRQFSPGSGLERTRRDGQFGTFQDHQG